MKCVDRPFICESCEFRFDDLDSLRLHKRKMEGVCDSYSPLDHHLYTRSTRFPSDDPFVKLEAERESECSSDRGEVKTEFEEKTSSTEHAREEEIKQEPCSSDHAVLTTPLTTPPISSPPTTPTKMTSDWPHHRDTISPTKIQDRFDPLRKAEVEESGHDTTDGNDDLQFMQKDKLREVRVRVKTISPFVHCPYCNQEYNIDDDSDAAFRLVIHVANHHPRENINFRFEQYNNPLGYKRTHFQTKTVTKTLTPEIMRKV